MAQEKLSIHGQSPLSHKTKEILLLNHLHTRDAALEIACLLEWEYQRALIVHLGRRIIHDRQSGCSIALLESSQVFLLHRIKSDRTQLLAQLAIHIKTGLPVDLY